MRIDGVVRDAAILTAIGIVPDADDPSVSIRRALGVSVALSEAEVHWCEFLDSSSPAACEGSNASWQRCQCYLQRNAFNRTPTVRIRKRIGAELRGCGTPRGSSARRSSSLNESRRTGLGTRNSPTRSDKTPPTGSPSSTFPKLIVA